MFCTSICISTVRDESRRPTHGSARRPRRRRPTSVPKPRGLFAGVRKSAIVLDKGALRLSMVKYACIAKDVRASVVGAGDRFQRSVERLALFVGKRRVLEIL